MNFGAGAFLTFILTHLEKIFSGGGQQTERPASNHHHLQ
jgi:hypothetical protein